MKRTELLNSEISSVIATMGHTDRIVLCDCGLPVATKVKRIDIALKKGVPKLVETLKTVLSELFVQEAILAQEIKVASPDIHREILDCLGQNVAISYVPHEEFKTAAGKTKAVIRTGECTSFANIILVSGVTF